MIALLILMIKMINRAEANSKYLQLKKMTVPSSPLKMFGDDTFGKDTAIQDCIQHGHQKVNFLVIYVKGARFH